MPLAVAQPDGDRGGVGGAGDPGPPVGVPGPRLPLPVDVAGGLVRPLLHRPQPLLGPGELNVEALFSMETLTSPKAMLMLASRLLLGGLVVGSPSEPNSFPQVRPSSTSFLADPRKVTMYLILTWPASLATLCISQFALPCCRFVVDPKVQKAMKIAPLDKRNRRRTLCRGCRTRGLVRRCCGATGSSSGRATRPPLSSFSPDEGIAAAFNEPIKPQIRVVESRSKQTS